MVQIWKGYYPNRIVRKYFVLQESELYCRNSPGRVAIQNCIAGWKAKIVLQEGQVYCNRGSLAAEETVLQYSLVGNRFVL